MRAFSASIDRGVESQPVLSRTAKTPPHVFTVVPFLQVPENVLLAIVPEYGFAKDQAERHFVGQRLQGRRGLADARKICVSPTPEVTMSISAIVSLHAESQGITREAVIIELDISGENRIGVWCPRETNPSLAA